MRFGDTAASSAARILVRIRHRLRELSPAHGPRENPLCEQWADRSCRRIGGGCGLVLVLVTLFGAAAPRAADPGIEADRKTVAALDVEYQAAVKANDAETMKRILHEDFVLVLGDGREFDRDDLLEAARSGAYRYERQDEIEGTQTVRVWGDTAVATAKLWVKGTRHGEPFDRKLWFSDTYVRTADGWKYVLGQASLPLPDGE